MLNSVRLLLQNKSGSILKRKPQDKCLDGHCYVKETRGPAMMAPSLLHAYIPKTNHRLEFPPRALPVGSAGIVHFMVDGTEQSWEWREREREWAIANSPISHLSFSSSLQLLWAMERLSRPSPYLSVSQQKQSDFSLGRKLDICICSKKSRRVSAKHKKYPYGPERPLGFMTEGLNG